MIQITSIQKHIVKFEICYSLESSKLVLFHFISKKQSLLSRSSNKDEDDDDHNHDDHDDFDDDNNDDGNDDYDNDDDSNDDDDDGDNLLILTVSNHKIRQLAVISNDKQCEYQNRLNEAARQ